MQKPSTIIVNLHPAVKRPGHAVKNIDSHLYNKFKIIGYSRDYGQVTIDDNGPGLPDEMKKKLSREIASSEIKADRRGLGLYLVKTLVSQLGGKMLIEDRVAGDYARGSKFIVMLPVCSD